jgi:hypothetical protein
LSAEDLLNSAFLELHVGSLYDIALGTTYDYWNQDKRQYFCCGLRLQNDKLSGIGCGAGARALGLLLLYDWAGDRIVVKGDDLSTEWRDGSIDISADLLVMLLEVDGTDWLDFAGLGFISACEIATHLREPRMIAALDEKFGLGVWRKRFVEYSHGNASTLADAIYEAQQRGLIRFRAVNADEKKPQASVNP